MQIASLASVGVELAEELEELKDLFLGFIVFIERKRFFCPICLCEWV
jgi:hypothetical protein